MNPSLLNFVAQNHLALGAYSAGGLGLYLFLRGFQLFVLKPVVGQFPKIVVSAATPGPALIAGSAVGLRTLAAPITGKECYVYRTSIWQQESGGKKEWKNVAEETGHLTFLIEDPTGTLLVEPLGAEVDLRPDFREEYTPPSSSSPPSEPKTDPELIESFLGRNGIKLDRPTRIEESCLQHRSSVFVAGTLSETSAFPTPDSSCNQRVGIGGSTIPDAAGEPRKPLRRESNPPLAVPAQRPEVIRLASGAVPSSTLQMSQQSKIAAALSRAGLAQTDVWTAPEISAPSVSSVAVTQRTSSDSSSGFQMSVPTANSVSNGHPQPASTFESTPAPSPRFTCSKGADDSIFIISNHSQFELPAPLGWKSIALVIAGSSLTVLGLCILLLGRLPGIQ